jgi:hypothetical protein
VRHGAAHAANALRALPIITYEARRVIKNQKNVRGLPHLMALKLAGYSTPPAHQLPSRIVESAGSSKD